MTLIYIILFSIVELILMTNFFLKEMANEDIDLRLNFVMYSMVQIYFPKEKIHGDLDVMGHEFLH